MAVRYDKRRNKRRSRIEIMVGRRKQWRRVATRFEWYPNTPLSAAVRAATVSFWVRVQSPVSTPRIQEFNCFHVAYQSRFGG